MEEHVVLVDESNGVIGTTPKATVHTTQTPLHRGFSVFLFNAEKQFFVTQRASSKKTFAGVYTNSFCGHPALNETPEVAAIRRAKEELGIDSITILKTLPYQYRFSDKNGIVENEICPIMIATTNQEPVINPSEVDTSYWTDWNSFVEDILNNPDKYSPWSREEVQVVQPELAKLLGV